MRRRRCRGRSLRALFVQPPRWQRLSQLDRAATTGGESVVASGDVSGGDVGVVGSVGCRAGVVRWKMAEYLASIFGTEKDK